MSVAESKCFSRGYLKGFFDTIGLLLGNAPTFELGDVDALSPDEWPDFVSQYSAALYGAVKDGGAIALLLPGTHVNTIVALCDEREPTEQAALADEDLPHIKEIFESAIGGGVAYFKEHYEQVLDLEEIQARRFDLNSMESLTELLGDNVTSAPFSFKVNSSVEGKGILLFSKELERVIPEDAAKAAGESEAGGPARSGAAAKGVTIDQDELDSILGDIGKKTAAPSAPPLPIADAPEPAPSNLDRVLDIRLTATARLGRVEMPIGDILGLGPGSIIEVGHLVDEPIELLVNGKLIARGDVVVVDEKFGLRITEIVSPQERIESLR